MQIIILESSKITLQIKIKKRYLLSYNEIPDYEVENHHAYIEGHIIENNDFSHNITGICTTIDSLVKIYKKYFMNNEKLIEEYIIYLLEMIYLI